MLDDDQAGTIAFLGAAGGAPCERITTHASHVFLSGDRAFKLKRALRYAYLDFSTAQKRIADCEREFALNHRLAPGLYLGVRRITRQADGTLCFDGAGGPIDAVVEMRRFPAEALFETMLEGNTLTATHVAGLAAVIAAAHESAEVAMHVSGAQSIWKVLALNETALRTTGFVAPERIDALASGFRAAFDAQRGLLDTRAAQGKVRRCHGDLILRNICLFEGVPTLFDCLEFDEELATIDVLYDLAFVLMDFWRRGERGFANLLFNRYLDRCEETDGLALLPFFMAIRATVRAHVAGALARSKAGEAERQLAEARDYFALAEALLKPEPPRLVALGGFSGSGKSTLSARLAGDLGPAPGARIIASDRIRKALHGVAPTQRLAPEAYRPEVSERVYRQIFERCRATLQAGHGVFAEAVFDRPADRAAIAAVAAGKPFMGFWLEAAPEILAARIEARRDDASDATAEVMRAQVARGAGEQNWTRLVATLSPDQLARDALHHLGLG